MRISSSIPFLALGFVALGCGDATPQQGSSSASASGAKSGAPAATSAAMATVAAPAAATGAAPAGGILGTCMDKSTGICKEYVGTMSAVPEDYCKGAEGKGVFTKGSAPCPKEKLLGTCEVKVTEGSEISHYYKEAGNEAASSKASCDIQSGTWAAAAGAAKK
jgi:hypothetical protein